MSSFDGQDPVEPGRPPPGRPLPPPARASASNSGVEAPRCRPIPARDLGAADGGGQGSDCQASEAPAEPAARHIEETQITIDDVIWEVTVLGRAGLGTIGRAPLLLLGFRRRSDSVGTEVDGRTLEALVVGTELEAVGVEMLYAAHASARPARTLATPADSSMSGGGRAPSSRNDREETHAVRSE